MFICSTRIPNGEDPEVFSTRLQEWCKQRNITCLPRRWWSNSNGRYMHWESFKLTEQDKTLLRLTWG